MKDIFVGLIIILVAFLIVDFIYTEKNTCTVSKNSYTDNYKCGILKKNVDIEIYLFDRYW